MLGRGWQSHITVKESAHGEFWRDSLDSSEEGCPDKLSVHLYFIASHKWLEDGNELILMFSFLTFGHMHVAARYTYGRPFKAPMHLGVRLLLMIISLSLSSRWVYCLTTNVPCDILTWSSCHVFSTFWFFIKLLFLLKWLWLPPGGPVIFVPCVEIYKYKILSIRLDPK